jgi:hypothetical protein
MKDLRECYIDRHAKDKSGQPVKRWFTKEGFKNLMEVDKARFIKQDAIKVTVPKEFINVTKDQSNKPENGQGVGNVAKRGPKVKKTSQIPNSGTDQSA